MMENIKTNYTFNIAKISGIYVIINSITNRFYIGESMDISKRWKQHIRELKNNTHPNKDLNLDYNRYGKDVFDFKLLQMHIGKTSVETKAELIILESAYINKYRNEYNLYNIHDTLQGYLMDDINCKISFGKYPIKGSIIRKLLSSSIEWIDGVPCIINEITIKDLLARKNITENHILTLITKMPTEIKPYVIVKEVSYMDNGIEKIRHSIIIRNLEKIIDWLQSTPFKVKNKTDIMLSYPITIEVE